MAISKRADVMIEGKKICFWKLLRPFAVPFIANQEILYYSTNIMITDCIASQVEIWEIQDYILKYYQPHLAISCEIGKFLKMKKSYILQIPFLPIFKIILVILLPFGMNKPDSIPLISNNYGMRNSIYLEND